MSMQHACHLLHRLNARAHVVLTLTVEKPPGPVPGFVVPEELKVFFEQVDSRPQLHLHGRSRYRLHQCSATYKKCVWRSTRFKIVSSCIPPLPRRTMVWARFSLSESQERSAPLGQLIGFRQPIPKLSPEPSELSEIVARRMKKRDVVVPSWVRLLVSADRLSTADTENCRQNPSNFRRSSYSG
jgi:hypothetical protein